LLSLVRRTRALQDCSDRVFAEPDMASRLGYTRLVDLEGRLRCRKCGVRGRASLEVELRPRD